MVFEIGEEEREPARAFLLRAIEPNLPLLDALEARRGAFFGTRDPAGSLSGLLLLEEESLAMVSVRDLHAAEVLGKALGAKGALGTLLAEREAAQVVWRAAAGGRTPRFAFDQSLFRITASEMGPYTCPQLRQARPGDLAEVVAIASAMFMEEIGIPPARDILESHVKLEVEAGTIWVVEGGGRIAFLLQVATKCTVGAELQRVYTHPEQRRRGIATLAIGQICRTLLGSLPRVILRVNESNHAALGLYRKLGFEPCARMKLLCA